MVVTRGGLPGLLVVSLAEEGLKVADVLVPIPRQHTEDEDVLVADWEELQIHGDVTHSLAQLAQVKL